MVNAKVHVNGVTYELPRPYDSQSIADLASRIEPTSGPSASEGQQFLRVGHVAPAVQRLDVLIDGASTSLTIRLDRVWASAAWLIG